MWYIIAFFALIFVGILDGHFSSVAAMLLLCTLGFISVHSVKNKKERYYCGKVFSIVFSVYVVSSLISSYSFLNEQFFYVVDPVEYIETYSNINSWSWNNSFTTLTDTYLFFADNNGLYNEGISLWSYIASRYFDGTSVFYLTFFQTLFGVLAALEIFKIFSLYFHPSKAYRYAIIFVLISLFHIYSIVIIRDIVIAFFYMWGLRKVIDKPKLSDIFVLLFVMIITMGVRLYTGLFFGAFIMFWLYKLLRESKFAKYKIVFIPLIVVGVVFVGTAFVSSMLIENTTEQLDEYNELYSDVSGLSARLRNLPMGIRQVAILFFFFLSLENFQFFLTSKSLSNFYLSILAVAYQIFGFVIFYGLMFFCFIKGFFKKMEFNEKWILIIMLVFIAINLSTHMDVRRSMEAIPFIYLFYMLVPEKYNRYYWAKMNKILVVISIMMMLTYTIIK